MNEPSSKSPNLSRIIEQFIKKIEKVDSKPLFELSPEEARMVLINLQKECHKEIVADVDDITILTNDMGSIPIRIVRPKGNVEKLPVILYIHGGGWILGGKETHDMLIRKLANGTNSVVIFPEYSLAPKAQFPVQINEIYAVLKYIHQYPFEFNIDETKIIIAGDSAGGNMAAAVALKSKYENGPKILYQALFYPVTDFDMGTKSYELFKDGPWLTKNAMKWFLDAYLPDKKQRDDIYASPLKATVEELQGLAPTLVVVSENDVLRDEGEMYARKLEEAGVNVFSVRVNATIHDFLMLNALSASTPVENSFLMICKILTNVLKFQS